MPRRSGAPSSSSAGDAVATLGTYASGPRCARSWRARPACYFADVTPAELLADRLRALPLGPALVASLAINVGLVAIGLPLAAVVARRFRHRPTNPPPPPITGKEIALAVACTLVNCVVFSAGLALHRRGLLRLAPDTPARIALDFAILFWAMDLAMYVFHRLAHHRWLFALAHATHHAYERVRPLSLFALNPLEASGFGALWIVLLCAHPAAPTSMVLYLTLNTLFGLVGHLGVEFVPKRWLRVPILRALGTSSFHAQHHVHERVNFGFYTVLWDRLFGTMHAGYERDFPE